MSDEPSDMQGPNATAGMVSSSNVEIGEFSYNETMFSCHKLNFQDGQASAVSINLNDIRYVYGKVEVSLGILICLPCKFIVFG